jgi:hypothetical protein
LASWCRTAGVGAAAYIVGPFQTASPACDWGCGRPQRLSRCSSPAFEWSDQAAEKLNDVAWADYSTAAVPSGSGRSIYDPYAMKALEAARARRRGHDRLTGWLRERLPGAFTDLDARLPALDIITTARATPFADDPPLTTYDYRRALDLDRALYVGTSPSLPGWRLALDNREMPDVLTLGGRTCDVFDERILGTYGGEVSRWGLANYMMERIDDLVCAWATARLLSLLRLESASVRDRAPRAHESGRDFARRLSRDVGTVLRRGADSAALADDILDRPEGVGPMSPLRSIDFLVESPFERAEPLRETWQSWMTREATMVRRAERDQRERLATAAQLTGLVVNVRTQEQMRWLTVAAVVFAVVAVALGVLQLVSA